MYIQYIQGKTPEKMGKMVKKKTVKEMGEILGVKDLKLTHSEGSGSMYTAKNKAGYGPRIFIAWDRKHLEEITRGE